MTITIQAVADAGQSLPNPYEFELSAGGMESPNNFKINGTRNTQPFYALRSASATFRDRYNAKCVVSFDVTRLHDSVSDAQEYMLLHQANIPGSGTVIITDELNNSYYMGSAVIDVTQVTYIGRTTRHSYQLTGGQISSTNPNP